MSQGMWSNKLYGVASVCMYVCVCSVCMYCGCMYCGCMYCVCVCVCVCICECVCVCAYLCLYTYLCGKILSGKLNVQSKICTIITTRLNSDVVFWGGINTGVSNFTDLVCYLPFNFVGIAQVKNDTGLSGY